MKVSALITTYTSEALGGMRIDTPVSRRVALGSRLIASSIVSHLSRDEEREISGPQAPGGLWRYKACRSAGLALK